MLQSPAAEELQRPAAVPVLPESREVRYNHSPLWKGSELQASPRRSPLRAHRGATVFENSTACAPIGHPYRPIECASRFDPGSGTSPSGPAVACQARNQAVQQYPVEAPGLASVYWQPLEWRIRQDSYVRAVLHGEFDPGSGRTLAACLTHASGATNRGLPRGRAANG